MWDFVLRTWSATYPLTYSTQRISSMSLIDVEHSQVRLVCAIDSTEQNSTFKYQYLLTPPAGPFSVLPAENTGTRVQRPVPHTTGRLLFVGSRPNLAQNSWLARIALIALTPRTRRLSYARASLRVWCWKETRVSQPDGEPVNGPLRRAVPVSGLYFTVFVSFCKLCVY